MVNCNPETVSTDYDTSDRLYFEPLTAEDVIEIVRVEQSQGPRARGHRAVRRPDPAQPREGAGTGGHPDPRHLARRDRPGRGPQALPAAAAPARPAPAAERHRHLAAGGRGDRNADRLSGRDPPVLRARRAGDGDRPRYGRAAALHQPRGHRVRLQPGADRPLSAERDRGRCRCRRRPRRGLCRRHHGAYRGGRHPFRRQRLLAAALQSRPPRRSPRSSGRRSRWRARSMSSG